MGLGLGLGLSFRSRSGAVSPLRLVATRSSVLQVAPSVTTSVTNKRLSRTLHYIGKTAATEMRIVVSGYYVNSGGIETNIGNDHTIGAVLEFPGGSTAFVAFTFSGSAVGTVTDGIAEYVSDPIYPAAFGLANYAANTAFFLRIERQSVIGGSLPSGLGIAVPAITGERTIVMADTSPSQLNASGVLNTGGATGASNVNTFPLPLAIIGRTTAAQVSVIGIGDSITQSQADNLGDGANGGGGFFVRAMYNLGFPFTNLAVAGTRAQEFAATTQKRETLYKYATHVFCGYGRNDIAALRTKAQLFADYRVIWSRAKAAGIRRVEQMTCVPSTTSTDSWATAANQTPLSGFANGSIRGDVVASLPAEVGSNGLDALVDMIPAVIDVTLTDRWKVDGVTAFLSTPEGVHPSILRVGDMTTILQTQAAAWAA